MAWLASNLKRTTTSALFGIFLNILFGWRESTILHVAWLPRNLKMTTRPT
ncbi:Hypothetical protein FKW44_005318 [Caligus rogercresseyi]|uniref:Uncharacterized protein n=1 Tax=Caligus rogercresseyi TaxID=217165 RepID=A0A7T8QRX9_CALRO|nr:Hypothetical protein FKW44_005318 [Caligus rogercresseyi]